jgi:hypothetical protein
MSNEVSFCPRIGRVCEFRAVYCDDLEEWDEKKQQLERQQSSLLGKFDRFSARIMPWLGEAPTDWGLRNVNRHIYDREALLNLNCNEESEVCIIEQHIEAEEAY